MYFEHYKSILYSDTLVPDIFIAEYMPSMDGDYVKIYLYCLIMNKYGKAVSEVEMAKKLCIDIDRVKEGLLYLESVGVISRKDDKTTLCDLKEKEINKIYRMKSTSSPEEAEFNAERNKRRNSVVAAINNKFFQGVMPPSWYTDIDAWFDKYRFEEDVMLTLFEHCYTHKALTKAYITKVAENWHSKNITNSFDLDNYYIEYQKFKDIKGKVAKKLRRKAPLTEYEEECIERWVTEYRYGFDIIEIALKKTIAKPEATFKYIDAIITDWFGNGLKSKEEVEAYDASRKQAPKQVKETGAAPQKGNFEQRKYDDAYYDSLFDNAIKTKSS